MGGHGRAWAGVGGHDHVHAPAMRHPLVMLYVPLMSVSSTQGGKWREVSMVLLLKDISRVNEHEREAEFTSDFAVPSATTATHQRVTQRLSAQQEQPPALEPEQASRCRSVRFTGMQESRESCNGAKLRMSVAGAASKSSRCSHRRNTIFDRLSHLVDLADDWDDPDGDPDADPDRDPESPPAREAPLTTRKVRASGMYTRREAPPTARRVAGAGGQTSRRRPSVASLLTARLLSSAAALRGTPEGDADTDPEAPAAREAPLTTRKVRASGMYTRRDAPPTARRVAGAGGQTSRRRPSVALLLTARLAALRSAQPAPGTSTTTSGDSETAGAARAADSEARGRAISEGLDEDGYAQDNADLTGGSKHDHEVALASGGQAASACEEEGPLACALGEASVKAAFALNAPGTAVNVEHDLLASALEEESVQAVLYSETSTGVPLADSCLCSDAYPDEESAPHVSGASERDIGRVSVALDSLRGSGVHKWRAHASLPGQQPEPPLGARRSRRNSVTTTVWSDGASGRANRETGDGDAVTALPMPARLPKPTHLVGTAAVSSASDEQPSASVATATPLAMAEVAKPAELEVAEGSEEMEPVGVAEATDAQAARVLSPARPPRSPHLLHNARIGAGSPVAPDVRTGPLSNRHFDKFGGRAAREVPPQRLATVLQGVPDAGLHASPSSGPRAQSPPSSKGDATSRTSPREHTDNLVQNV